MSVFLKNASISYQASIEELNFEAGCGIDEQIRLAGLNDHREQSSFSFLLSQRYSSKRLCKETK